MSDHVRIRTEPDVDGRHLLCVVELDDTHFSALRAMDIDEDRARAVGAALAEHREPPQ
jgi:hypothetical protein